MIDAKAGLPGAVYPDQKINEQATEINRLRAALRTIADMPIPEQDNMIAANMRAIAASAVSEPA